MEDDLEQCPTCDSVMGEDECEHCRYLAERLDFDEYRRTVDGAPASALAVAAARQVKDAAGYFGPPVRTWADEVLGA